MNSKAQKVSRTETLAGIFILLLLAGIATAVFYRQFKYNPAVTSIQNLAQKQEEGAIPSNTPEKKSMRLPDGMHPMTPLEIFTADDLYEKIDGKADLYLSAGFKRLRCQRIQAEKYPGIWMEVFVYEMETPENAFAVFSMQRREDAIPADLGDFSYQTQNAFFMAQGAYYVEVIGSRTGDEMMRLINRFSVFFIAQSGSGTSTVSGFKLFPEACGGRDNIAMIPSSAFGFNQLDNVYTALCRDGDTEITLFYSNRGTVENAVKMAAAYANFLKGFGGTDVGFEPEWEDAQLIEIFGSYELFFTYGSYFCGIHEAETPASAQAMAAVFYQHLGELSK